MKKSTWHKHHKWFGLILGFFLIMFSLSGLVLNHPMLFSEVNVSRAILPSNYQYQQWNKGLLRGSIAWNKRVLLYGNGGIWVTDSTTSFFDDFNKGLPEGADFRQIRGIVNTPTGSVLALGQYELYQLQPHKGWNKLPLPCNPNEKLCDITAKGDSIIITSRSHLYLSLPPYKSFTQITLPPAEGNDGKVSLFRTIWLLHSGELFGTIGVLFVDCIALVLIFLTLSGILYWFMPHVIKGKGQRLKHKLGSWHNSIGKLTIVFTLFLCVTGWLLRPPALIAIASGQIPPIPFTTLHSTNAWHDKLRSLRYDNEAADWLLYTSDGFFSMNSLQAKPHAEPVQPPVSVMGINVEEKDNNGRWLIGSFSGMYKWDRKNNRVTDYYTNLMARPVAGIPISANVISGYTNDFIEGPTVIDYNTGTDALPMPAWLSTLPMSLRNVCIEIHTGRIYTFIGFMGIFYIFLIGIAIAWCIWTGWKIRYNK